MKGVDKKKVLSIKKKWMVNLHKTASRENKSLEVKQRPDFCIPGREPSDFSWLEQVKKSF